MPKIIPMIGKRFGRLTVLEKASENKNGQYSWICRCDCGQTTAPIAGSYLRRGQRKSCGCLRREIATERGLLLNKSHGMYKSRIYSTWNSMKERCYNANNPRYPHYGGRGIRVCEEWLNSFQAFHDWAVSSGYSDDLTIDRIDVNGDYCPENCRWATIAEQNSNTTRNVSVEINGKTQTLSQWAKESGIHKNTLFYRHKHGYSGEDLIRRCNYRKTTKTIHKGE